VIVGQKRDDRCSCLPVHVVVADILEGMYALTQVIQRIRSNRPYDHAHPPLRKRPRDRSSLYEVLDSR
jgi:hypothetical protein